jgi:hypothetical protein
MNIRSTLFAVLIMATTTLGKGQETIPRPSAGEDRKSDTSQRVRGAGPDRRSARGPAWKEMSEADRKAATSFMQEHFPRMVVELDRLKESSPEKFERRMERVAPEMHRLMEAKKKDPRRATVLIRERQVGLQLQALAKEYHSAAGDEEKLRIRKTVRELAAQEFDDRLERRKLELHQLETKLAELKDRLSEAESVRDATLDRRTRELLERKAKRGADSADEQPARRGRSSRGEKNPD